MSTYPFSSNPFPKPPPFPGLGVITGSELLRRQERRSTWVTHIPLLDRFEEGGLPRGILIEISGKISSGRFAMDLAVLSAATRAGELAAFIDLGSHLDPQAADALGIDLTRLLWVRPSEAKEAAHSAEMILNSGFSLVVLDLPERPRPGFNEGVWIRLSRAARDQKAVLWVSTLIPLTGSAADLTVRADRSRPLWAGDRNAPKLLMGLSVDLSIKRRRGTRRELSGKIFLPMAKDIIDVKAHCLSAGS